MKTNAHGLYYNCKEMPSWDVNEKKINVFLLIAGEEAACTGSKPNPFPFLHFGQLSAIFTGRVRINNVNSPTSSYAGAGRLQQILFQSSQADFNSIYRLQKYGGSDV